MYGLPPYVSWSGKKTCVTWCMQGIIVAVIEQWAAGRYGNVSGWNLCAGGVERVWCLLAVWWWVWNFMQDYPFCLHKIMCNSSDLFSRLTPSRDIAIPSSINVFESHVCMGHAHLRRYLVISPCVDSVAKSNNSAIHMSGEYAVKSQQRHAEGPSSDFSICRDISEAIQLGTWKRCVSQQQWLWLYSCAFEDHTGVVCMMFSFPCTEAFERMLPCGTA